MTRALSIDRRKKRHFIDSLLHPENILVYNLPVPINARLRGYQQEGLNWLNFLNQYGLNGILCDDLGLGKTLQTICILAGSHHERKAARNCTAHDTSTLNYVNCDSPALPHPISLVVCPSTLCGHWLHEVNQFVNSDHLSPIIYVGGPSVRRSLQSQISQFDLVIASYDVVRNDIEFFQSIFWHYVVLDEGHIIKSSKSKVSRALKQLCAQHRLILTGTPIQNRVCELWSLFDFLMPDFLGTESEFASRFARPVAASRDPKASKSEQRAGHKALENLHRLVLPFMLRRLKEDVVADLPPKIVQDFACELTNIQMQLYEAFTKSAEGQRLLTAIETENSHSSANRTASNSLNLSVTYGASLGGKRYGFQALRYLQAVCNHPCLALKPTHPLFADMKRVVQSEFGPNVSLDSVHLSGKLLSLCRLLTDCGFGTPNFTAATPSTSVVSAGNSNEIIGDQSLMNQHRALIFFQTREMLQLTANVLRLHFPWLTYTRLDGSVPVNERHARVTRFNQDPSIDLMLLTTVVGGLGLNLTGADTVIFVEHDWNPCKDLQAMDRVHRIGQRRVVSVYRLITQDSIEEQIMNLQAFKLHLANTVISTDNRSLSDMDTEHLFDRLTTSTMPPTKRFVPNSANVDDLEVCYEKEYNLDEFILKLNQCNQ
ncbi:hypothetical protein PHET_05589 [Paragonimus heterotremus]|uniref:TATA-binding protein-associated factor 172 n=1 Tax=Paragonimus heterotremus TaxID=100268 RepID=A0A8J4TJY6_9TREM|nr:hypothetical protein PHET_05589 [Paragonimus heterotremus]